MASHTWGYRDVPGEIKALGKLPARVINSSAKSLPVFQGTPMTYIWKRNYSIWNMSSSRLNVQSRLSLSLAMNRWSTSIHFFCLINIDSEYLKWFRYPFFQTPALAALESKKVRDNTAAIWSFAGSIQGFLRDTKSLSGLIIFCRNYFYITVIYSMQ